MLDDAIERLDEIVGFERTEAEHWQRKGDFLRLLDRHQLAIDSYSKALSIDPDFFWPYHRRGDCLKRLRQYEGAIADYTKAIELDPEHYFSHRRRGDCFQQLGQYENSIVDYEKALELSENRHNEIFPKLIVCYQKLDKIDDAIERLDEIVGLETADAKHWHRRGDFLRLIDRHQLAVDSYSKALEIDPASFWSRKNRGSSVAQTGGKDVYAVDDYQWTKNLPNDRDEHFPYEQLYFELGERLLGLEKNEMASDILGKGDRTGPQCYQGQPLSRQPALL